MRGPEVPISKIINIRHLIFSLIKFQIMPNLLLVALTCNLKFLSNKTGTIYHGPDQPAPAPGLQILPVSMSCLLPPDNAPTPPFLIPIALGYNYDVTLDLSVNTQYMLIVSIYTSHADLMI